MAAPCCRQTITFPQAVFGATLPVETLQGEATVEVPPGTRQGEQFVLRDRGVPRLGSSGYGRHIVSVVIDVPKPRNLSEDEEDLLRRLAEVQGTKVKDRGVISKVKDLFG